MATDHPPTHEHLLTLANMVKAAADDGDVERLRWSAWRLYDGLVEHLEAEAPALFRAAPAERRILRAGQRRITDAVAALVRNLEFEAAGCNCEDIADLLAAELTLQAEDERRCLPAAAGGRPCSRARAMGGWSVPSRGA